MRKMLIEMLTRAGYLIESAENGLQGLKLIQDLHFDLVITDIIMPEKEGLELLSELRKRDTPVKVIAISGGGRYQGIDYLAMAQKLGAMKTLAKPFGMREMLCSIKEVLAS